MKNRILPFTISTMLALLLCVGFVLGPAASKDHAYRYLKVFAEVLGLVRSHYVEPVDDGHLMHGAYQGLLSGLDPYSGYLDAGLFASMSKEPEGPAGPGIDVVKARGALEIASVWSGSPADEAGLSARDLVWAIDGESTWQMSLAHARRLLTGKKGTNVVLQVFRVAERRRQEIDLERTTDRGPAMISRIESVGVGYLHVTDPSRVEAGELSESLEELKRRGARKLLVDLRGAVRGDVVDAVTLAAPFLGESLVTVSRERDGEDIEHKSRGPLVWDDPVWILVGARTAGAAEILAGALRDGAGATMLGERTRGQGARQELIPLPEGDGLILSVNKYLTPSGEAWHDKGLSVSVTIPGSPLSSNAGGSDEAGEDEDEDRQLRRALEVVIGDADEGAIAA